MCEFALFVGFLYPISENLIICMQFAIIQNVYDADRTPVSLKKDSAHPLLEIYPPIHLIDY
jgi:hypothetical protein